VIGIILALYPSVSAVEADKFEKNQAQKNTLKLKIFHRTPQFVGSMPRILLKELLGKFCFPMPFSWSTNTFSKQLSLGEGFLLTIRLWQSEVICERE
jgi:hypothetical protein